MKRPCQCRRVEVCRACWRSAYDPAWGGIIDSAAPPKPGGDSRAETPAPRPPCVHEGPIIEWCRSCGDQRHVRHCLFDGHDHDRCARDHPDPRADVQVCARCPHFTAALTNPLETRHLLYHVMPVKGLGIWQLNLDRLKARLPLFTGRRCVAIVEDPKCDPPGAVQDYLRGERVDAWIVKRNDSHLREVVTWHALWEQVANLPGATFYGHAKGVTRPFNRSVSIHRWTDLLYQANLDFWPVVAAALTTHPITGALKKVGAGFAGSRSSFHYSGTFYWVRNDALGQRWREIDRVWWGNESWPGLHWRPEQGGCLFHEGRVPSLDMYRLSYTERVEQEFEQWKSQHARHRSVTG